MSEGTDYMLQCCDIDDSKLYATKQQIKEAERTDYGKIKWDNFERFVSRVRDEIDDFVEYIKTQPSKQRKVKVEPKKPIKVKPNKVEPKKVVLSETRDIFKYCVYNMYTNELIGEYPTGEAASLAMGLPKHAAYTSIIMRCGVYKKAGLLFVRTKVGEKVNPVKNKRQRICAYNLSTNELIGTYSSVKNMALDLDISLRSAENSIYKRNGIYRKGNMRFSREMN